MASRAEPRVPSGCGSGSVVSAEDPREVWHQSATFQFSACMPGALRYFEEPSK